MANENSRRAHAQRAIGAEEMGDAQTNDRAVFPPLPPLNDAADDLILSPRIELPDRVLHDPLVSVEDQTDVHELVAMGAECLKVIGACDRKGLRIARQEAVEHQRVHNFYHERQIQNNRQRDPAVDTLAAIAARLRTLGGFGDAKSVDTPWGRFGFRTSGENELFFHRPSNA